MPPAPWATGRTGTATGCSKLEADATSPAEYVLLEHTMDRITPGRQARIDVYLRRIQGEHGVVSRYVV